MSFPWFWYYIRISPLRGNYGRIRDRRADAQFAHRALRGGTARTSFCGRPRQDFDARAWRSPVRTGVKIPSDPRKCSRAAPPLRAPSRNECVASSRRDGPMCEREDFRRCGMAAGRLVHLGGRMRKQKPEARLIASGPCRRDRRNPDREQSRTARRRWRVSWWQHDSRMRPGIVSGVVVLTTIRDFGRLSTNT